jgi:hypothetical protein
MISENGFSTSCDPQFCQASFKKAAVHFVLSSCILVLHAKHPHILTDQPQVWYLHLPLSRCKCERMRILKGLNRFQFSLKLKCEQAFSKTVSACRVLPSIFFGLGGKP